MTELDSEQLLTLRQDLRALLEMEDLDPAVEKIVRQILRLLENTSQTPEGIERALEKMLRRAPMSPEQAAMHLTQKIRANVGRRNPTLGRPFGRGTPPREKDDPRLRAAAKELTRKVRESAERRRRPGVRS